MVVGVQRIYRSGRIRHIPIDPKWTILPMTCWKNLLSFSLVPFDCTVVTVPVPVPPDYLQTSFDQAVAAVYLRKKDGQAVSEVKELGLEWAQKVAVALVELELVARKQYDFRMNIAVIFHSDVVVVAPWRHYDFHMTVTVKFRFGAFLVAAEADVDAIEHMARSVGEKAWARMGQVEVEIPEEQT